MHHTNALTQSLLPPPPNPHLTSSNVMTFLHVQSLQDICSEPVDIRQSDLYFVSLFRLEQRLLASPYLSPYACPSAWKTDPAKRIFM